jgi:DNA-binding transcriptional MerR regulator
VSGFLNNMTDVLKKNINNLTIYLLSVSLTVRHVFRVLKKEVKMEWLSIPELARKIGTADNTVRRYLKRFPDYFYCQTVGGIKRFSPETVEILKYIFNLYHQKGKSREEVNQALQLKYGNTITIDHPKKLISEKTTHYDTNASLPVVLPEIARVANAFERIATALENQTTGSGSAPAITENRSIQNKEILTDSETASFLEIATRTLRDWRSNGKGPAFVQMGNKIRYRKKDIDAYLDNQTITPTKD